MSGRARPLRIGAVRRDLRSFPSLDLYLDGTAEHTGSTELPVMDRSAIALQINEGKPKLVRPRP